MKKYVFLKNSSLFKKLDNKFITYLSDISVIKEYKKGNIIAFENEQVEGILIIGTGSVKVYKTAETGQTFIIKIAKPGDAIAEVAVLLDKPVYPANVEVLENSEIVFIPVNAMLTLLKKEPVITFNLLSNFAGIIYKFTGKMEELALHNVRKRILKYIKEKCKFHQSNTIELDISKQTLAALTGTIPETISRVFKSLEEDGLIKIDRKKITLLNI